MPQVSLDFSNVEEFTPLPPGNYPITVEKVELRLTKGTTDQFYLNWDLSVADGEYTNRHLFFMTSLSEKALWRLKATFLNLGVIDEETVGLELNVDDGTNLLIEPMLVGLPAIAVVSNEVYQGKVRDRVEDLLPPQASAKMTAELVKPAGVTIGKPATPQAPARKGLNLK